MPGRKRKAESPETKESKTETPEAKEVVEKPAPPVKAEPKLKKLVKVWQVVKGKSTTSLKGILDQGTEVKSEYFSNGEETFEKMKEIGLIEEVEKEVE